MHINCLATSKGDVFDGTHASIALPEENVFVVIAFAQCACFLCIITQLCGTILTNKLKI